MVPKMAIELIKKWEGLRLESYQDSGGVWTIGYGSTGKDVVSGITWTLAQCEQRLNLDCEFMLSGIRKLVTVQLNENQDGALLSFTYNLGLGRLSSSTLLKKINTNDMAGAAEEFLRWNKANGKMMQGLANRRSDERKLFLNV